MIEAMALGWTPMLVATLAVSGVALALVMHTLWPGRFAPVVRWWGLAVLGSLWYLPQAVLRQMDPAGLEPDAGLRFLGSWLLWCVAFGGAYWLALLALARWRP